MPKSTVTAASAHTNLGIERLACGAAQIGLGAISAGCVLKRNCEKDFSAWYV